ncbi:50S ribosomal protein L19e [Candidatus Bilamarchaeum dharawalense]|uniref:50S ribosomal protein L19e n=1 Tax=Candidatus Bilamarchaeum dharawalense TaxID=2885759 RepID=A0A5E4LS14_9ARCH|nr:50S ribosomal protein L19e [Candidatus Bilamarchaeum dharawalense]
MTIATVRRLAADIFNVGENKIRISPDGLKDAEGALTRSDVKSLIEKGVVTKKPNLGRASTKKRFRRGHGHRKGSSTINSKEVWMMKIRAQRKFLNLLLSTGAVKNKDRRILYSKLKSGIFRNKKAFLLYLKDNKFVPNEFEPPKAEYTPKPKKAPKQKKAAVAKTPEVKKTEPVSEPKKGEKQ